MRVVHLAAAAVVGEAVGRARTRRGDKAGLGKGNNAALDGSGGGQVLESNEVGSESSNVGRGHGSTRDGVGGAVAANPGGLDVGARGEDIDNGAVVGERGPGISVGGGADSDGGRSRGRRVVGSVGVVVTGSDGEGETSSDSGSNSVVDGSRVATTEGHVGNSLLGDALALSIGSSPLNTRDNTGVGSRAGLVEDLDTNDVGLLSNTVDGTSSGTGTVGAVTVQLSNC